MIVSVKDLGQDILNKYLHYSAGCVLFTCPAFIFVSYLIATYLKGIPHAIKPNVEANRFELIPITKDSQISKAFCSPNKTGAMSILNWINENDKQLASTDLTVQPEAKFFR